VSVSIVILYTGHTQKNGAVSIPADKQPHHSFVYALYIQMQTNIYVKGIHLAVQGLIPVSTVFVDVTMDK
jgi:hypothetical protein